MTTLRIATRGSRLALWQAETVKAALQAAQPGVTVELVLVTSQGDADRTRPLHEMGGVGVFTKEVQDAVLDGRADLAVHSLKDLPTVPHPELELAAVPERGPTADALLSPQYMTLAALPQGAAVATGSLRRRAQLLRRRPDLRIEEVRGNVDTRVKKLLKGRLDAMVLARAGLERLGLLEHATEFFAPETMLPAVGQGALGIECRRSDERTRSTLQSLEHEATRIAVTAERAFLAELQGGCQMPIGALALLNAGRVTLEGNFVTPDGATEIRGRREGAAKDAASIGLDLAAEFLSRGVRELMPK
ncbi:MAG TPA: hydroxymethylbilane synthase [Planctomycetia bacterium]|nr:hydroxymethylbilane synthase [Planctomycetia bacterium]